MKEKSRMKEKGKVKIAVAMMCVLSVGVMLTLAGCGSSSGSTRTVTQFVDVPGPGPINSSFTTSSWLATIDGVSKSWPGTFTHTVTLSDDGAGTYSIALTPDPTELNFIAGEPYILRILHGGGTEKHYFTAPDFYKSIALRKVQTDQAEYKAPYLNAIEMKVIAGGGAWLDIYFVAVVPGTYGWLCTQGGHAVGGMEGVIQITNSNSLPDVSLNLELSDDYDRALDADVRRSGSNAVWSSSTAITVDYSTGTSGDPVYFVNGSAIPNENLILDVGTGYIITLTNSDSQKHYWNGDKGIFFQTLVTRKVDEVNAEIKVPYFKAIELLPGAVNSTTLYVVPTVAGTYYMYCSISGHEAAGMFHNVIVQ